MSNPATEAAPTAPPAALPGRRPTLPATRPPGYRAGRLHVIRTARGGAESMSRLDYEAPGPAAAALPPEPPSAAAAGSGKWMVLLAAFLGWMFDGMEQGLYGLTGRPALLEMLGPGAEAHIGTWLARLAAVFLVGMALGGLTFGWLGDRIGRVRAMVWSVATYSVFSGLCGFAATPAQLAVCRFAASVGMGGEWALGVALIMEVWPARWRPVLAGLIGAAANFGFLLIALVGLGLGKF